MPFRISALPWLALALIPSVLTADDLEPDVHLGLQVAFVTPRQDFRAATTRTGTSFGLFFEQDLDPTWSVRTRLDYTSFGQGSPAPSPDLAGFIPPTALRVTVDQASIGGEVRMHPKGLGGVFFLGGAGGSRVEFRSVGPDPSGVLPLLTTKAKTSFKFSMAAGVGITLLPACSATLRYTTLQEGGLTFATVEAALEYRF